MKNKVTEALLVAILSITAFAGCSDSSEKPAASKTEHSSTSAIEIQNDTQKSCCHHKSSEESEKPDCCEEKSSESSHVPDCCGD